MVEDVIDLVKVSPSQIKTWRACKRKWALEKIDGLRSPSTGKQQFGTDVHAVLQRYLQDNILPPNGPEAQCAAQCLNMGWIPEAQAQGVVCEGALEYPAPEVGAIVWGYGDVLAGPGVLNPHLPCVIDYKTTSNLRWALKEAELRTDPQALVYAHAAALRYGVESVICRWIYLSASNPRDGGPRQPKGARMVETVIHVNDPSIKLAWQGVLESAGEIVHARRTYQAGLDGAPCWSSCGDYGGCPHVGICSPRAGDTLVSLLFGRDELTDSQCAATITAPPKGEHVTSLMNKIAELQKAPKPTPTPAATPAPTAPAPTPAPAPATVTPEVVADRVTQMIALNAAKGINPPAASVLWASPPRLSPTPAPTDETPAPNPALPTPPGAGDGAGPRAPAPTPLEAQYAAPAPTPAPTEPAPAEEAPYAQRAEVIAHATAQDSLLGPGGVPDGKARRGAARTEPDAYVPQDIPPPAPTRTSTETSAFLKAAPNAQVARITKAACAERLEQLYAPPDETPAPPVGLTVLLDCAIAKGSTPDAYLSDILRAVGAELTDEGAASWEFSGDGHYVDKRARFVALFAVRIAEVTGTLVGSSTTPESIMVLDALTAAADVVIRGTR